MSLLAFLAASCRAKDNNIYVDHAKEKNHFRKSEKYKPPKSCKSWK